MQEGDEEFTEVEKAGMAYFMPKQLKENLNRQKNELQVSTPFGYSKELNDRS